MSIRHRLAKLRGAARQVVGNYRCVILLYHQVSDWHRDPWANCVSPPHFREHMEVLGGRHVVRLTRLVDWLRRGELPRRAIAITFDDGYSDNLHNAAPLLQQYGHPATLFLTTGGVGSGREHWWDELESLLLCTGELPPVLELEVRGRLYRWRLGAAANYDRDTACQHSAWNAWRRPPGRRQKIYQTLWRALFVLGGSERRRVLDELAAWAGAPPVVRTSHRCLSDEEVAALKNTGLVDLGTHSVTHPALPALSIAEQRAEIRESRERCEELAGRTVREFAFPFGRYDATTISLLRDAGFTSACTALAGALGRRTDPMRLPRVAVGDWSGDEFARRLFGRQTGAVPCELPAAGAEPLSPCGQSNE